MNLQPLLIELGTEELPVKALPGLAQSLFDGVIAGLQKRGVEVDVGGAKPLFSPRRLAVLLPGVATRQAEQANEVLGPYVNIALDADGQPTRALQGFAAKNGIEWTRLERTTDAKGERFVHRSVNAGADTATLLPEILQEAVAAMPIPKPMRWGAHEHAFARPLHWLVLLLGDAVVPADLFGIASGRETRGHRFHHPAGVSIASANDYLGVLESAFVLVDPAQRRERIRHQVETAAAACGGVSRITDDNLEQVVALVEWPAPVTCSFEQEFLAVPQEALIETMEINQKFFPVLSESGALTEHFIGIANIESKDVSKVRAGYERVIRPRFADAKFFFDEDLKQGLQAMGDGLKTVTYQAKLGSVHDKVQRVAALAQAIATQVGVDPELARRAAALSKNDLQSRMVNEFPELQGIAGRHYALAGGEPEAIALAIDEAYRPRYSGDDIALSPLGKVLAIAERLDTLAGGFAAELKPTGNKDPFALRRNALGLARTMIESGVDLSLKRLLSHAELLAFLAVSKQDYKKYESLANELQDHDIPFDPEGFKKQYSPKKEGANDLYAFILDRLRGYYADKGVPATHFNAVAALQPASLYDFDRRLDAIGQFAALPEAAALAAANKRIGNILRKVEGEVPHAIDSAALVEPAEERLAEALLGVEAAANAALAQHDYVSTLRHLAQLREPIDAFFDGVMVMADDEKVRANRLALLKRIADRFLSVADVSLLAAG
ncbi:glycine--tRNA ligase subunit beta [Xanthomonadaceae bacterium JHOS43]|nr:glycine--tRNA ligase subunit beta [Xanthomonadaceae bacterium JHOS43]MCX7561965.1 glycine--tRNA ligase subunit beta [Xanthomonadaceae bacterium XH05]